MNKNIILTALAILPFMAFAQQSFTIKAQLSKVDAPAKAYLVYSEEGQRVIDSVDINKGVFAFAGTVSQPEKAMLAIDLSGKGISQMTNPDLVNLYLQQGEITVKGTDSVSKAILGGTSLNIDQQKLNKSLASVLAKEKAFMVSYRAATQEEKGNEDFQARMDQQYTAIQDEKKSVLLAFVKNQPASIVSLHSLITYGGSDPEAAVIEPVFNSLSSEVKETDLGKNFKSRLELAKRFGIGAVAPDFTQNDPDGKPVSLSSFKGKYVLIDFWASWCQPCRKENPNLVAAYHKFKDKNFTVLGVSLDKETGRDAWLSAIDNDKLTWTQVSDLKFWNNEAAKLYGVRAIPQNYLLDPTGKIIGKNLRGEELHRKLAEILN